MTAQDKKRSPADAASLIDDLNVKAASDELLALEDLVTLMAILRDPTRGCPWDREQTFMTIAPYTIEEAYEVADAIARGDIADLKEELGDLLLQIVYHTQMAREDGHFDFTDVADAITRKMIRRHPHVFGDDDTRASIEIRGLWDRVKAEEAKTKQKDGGGAEIDDGSVLSGVPVGLPALTRAVKLQKRAARVGFDWTEAAQILDKVKEEIGEFEQDLSAGDQDGMEEEFGDLLFVLANLARRLSIDPEATLRSANTKFERRFQYIEKRLREIGRSPETATLAEMDALWDEAKAQEKAGG